jgi:molecular chaperone DnaK (HSP70)
MPEDRLCGHCSAWLCGADDAFCGYCGRACAQLELSVKPSILQVGHWPPWFSFRLTNPSCAELAVDDVKLPDWLSLEMESVGTLSPGQTVAFQGKPRARVTSRPEGGEVVVSTPLGRAIIPIMAIEERPTVMCLPPEIEVWPDGRMERRRVPLTLAPRSGLLRVRGIRQGPLGGLSVVAGVKGGTLISPENGASILVEADGARFQHQSSASLLVEYDGPHGPASTEVQVRVAVRNPPQMHWAEEHQDPAERFQTGRQPLRFTFKNQAAEGGDGGAGNAKLVIESVTLTPPPECDRVPVRLLTPLPIEVPGGEPRTVDFELDLETAPARSSEPYHFTLEVRANRPVPRKSVPVFVRALPEFDGVLAIDFGSSNTCCAVLETGRNHELLRIDGQEVVSPTVIRYFDLRGPQPLVETGARIKGFAATSEKVAASTLSKLKQRLGDARQEIPVRPENSDRWTTRLASEAAADYLHQIRKVAETGKSTIFREFILTHPAICSQRQYRNLRKALESAFGSNAKKVEFIQEPIAALIPFFDEMARKPQQPGYSVASFDLGGGTTDIALVRVEHNWHPSGAMEIHPRILGSRGVRFGGEDLTDYLEAALEENCRRLLAVERPNARLIRKNLSGASTDDVLRNRAAFRKAAEQLKASLSDEGRENGAIPKDPREQPYLRVLLPGDEGADDYRPSFDNLLNAGGSGLTADFLDFTRRKVEEMSGLLKTMASRVEKLDYIQLSGKTTFLPVVTEVLMREFPGTEIQRAPNPKECVVAGACMSRSMTRGTLRRLVLPPGMQRMTSSIGLFDLETNRFLALIPVDTAIPPGGIEQRFEKAWDGEQAVVIWENLGADEKEIESRGGAALTKLGTWKPERVLSPLPEIRWALRLTLRDFVLSVEAIGPEGQTVAFRRVNDSGDL